MQLHTSVNKHLQYSVQGLVKWRARRHHESEHERKWAGWPCGGKRQEKERQAWKTRSKTTTAEQTNWLHSFESSMHSVNHSFWSVCFCQVANKKARRSPVDKGGRRPNGVAHQNGEGADPSTLFEVVKQGKSAMQVKHNKCLSIGFCLFEV